MNALLKGGGQWFFFGWFIAIFQDANGTNDFVMQFSWKIKAQNN